MPKKFNMECQKCGGKWVDTNRMKKCLACNPKEAEFAKLCIEYRKTTGKRTSFMRSHRFGWWLMDGWDKVCWGDTKINAIKRWKEKINDDRN